MKADRTWIELRYMLLAIFYHKLQDMLINGNNFCIAYYSVVKKLKWDVIEKVEVIRKARNG